MHFVGIIHSLIQATFGRQSQGVSQIPLLLKGARVRYINEGRSGRVVFSMGFKSFEMYYEFGGGDTVAIIDIPSPDEWLAKTRFADELRQPILEFIGETVTRDQVSLSRGCYEIHDDCIRIIARGSST